jgi:hypothetical protein
MKDNRDRTEYRKKYWEANKERLKPKHREYWINYSKNNADKLKEKSKLYYHANKDKMEEYYQRNKDKIKEAHKQYYLKNRDRIRKQFNEYYNKQYKQNMSSWTGFIPQEINCQICGRKIFLGKKNRESAIHFDHKGENEIIKQSPSSWLYRHKRTPKNEKICESCNFGYLCRRCNSFLPTRNRKDFIRQIIKYIGGV